MGGTPIGQPGAKRGQALSEVGRGEHDPLDPTGHEELDDGREGRHAAIRDLLQQQAVALGLRLRGDPVERLRDTEVGQPGGNHAQGVGPPLHEAARDGVRLEPGLGDGRLDRSDEFREPRRGAC